MKVTKLIRLQDLGLEIRTLPEKIANGASTGLNSNNIVELARAFCPVFTGTLRDTIRSEQRGPHHIAFIAGGVQYINPLTGKWVDYAKYVHEGTSKMPPRPFLLQAMLAERDKIKMEMRRAVMESI